jgi:hypothetical protein
MFKILTNVIRSYILFAICLHLCSKCNQLGLQYDYNTGESFLGMLIKSFAVVYQCHLQ